MAGDQAIHPINRSDDQEAAFLTIQATHRAADGSEWLRSGDGYSQIVRPWAVESHIGPIKSSEKLGDIDSWVRYVVKYGEADTALLTWSDKGLRAVLDYHTDLREPGRCAWVAEHPFLRTRQWDAWQALVSRGALSQKALIEALEDHRDDVVEPKAADLVTLLRALRANVNVAAESEMLPNGNTALSYSRQTTTSVELPQAITIGIPVLKGHTTPDENGIEGPVRYAIDVLVRVDVLDGGKLSFRLAWPGAERALELAVADRVRKAEEDLPADFLLLRAIGA